MGKGSEGYINADILLINPFSWMRGAPAYVPYGILYLASYIRERGISVKVFDCNADTRDPLDIIEEEKPKAVGLSVLTGPVISEALRISRECKRRFPEIKIIWGGLHPTLFPDYVLQEKSVDYIIQGEGEESLYQLLSTAFKTPRLIPPRELINLDDSPPPAWDLIDIEKYIANRFFASRTLTMNTSRGCPQRCAFCFNQGMPQHKWRGVSAINIYKQLLHLNQTYNINGIQFYEDSFDTDRERVRIFCKYMKGGRLGVAWSHFSNVAYSNRGLLTLEKEAGCKYVEYGVESGNERMLKLLNKRQTTSQIKEAFKTCKDVGLMSAALFMIGLPTETTEELK